MNQTSSHFERPLFVKMVEHGLLSVQGPDSAKFLQGQCTCDVKEAENDAIVLGSHCNPKGRVLTSFILIKISDDEFILRMKRDILAATLEAFKKYSVFFKVTLSESALTPIALLECDVTNALQVDPPESGLRCNHNGLIIANHGQDFIELWVDSEHQVELTSKLRNSIPEAPTTKLDMHFIERGIVEICALTQGEFIPQDLNYQLINAISFTKGCYTGQEIIARMQYRAQLKKHTYKATIATQDIIPVGSTIVDPNDTNKDLGVVVSSALDFTTGMVHALIVSTVDVVSNMALVIEKNSKAKITWITLPYAIT